MIKLKKKLILFLLLSAILVPTVASAGIYFMDKEEGSNDKRPTTRPCESRGFNIIQKKHCGPNEIGSGGNPLIAEKENSQWCKNPSGVGTTEILHRRCICPEDYKYTEEQCTGWNQDPMGSSCQAQNPSPLYKECGCNLGKFAYSADSSDCPADTQVDGSKVITQRVSIGDGFCNTGPQGQNGDLRFAKCACPPLEYTKTCGVPFVGDGYSCNNRYKNCVCDRTVYSKRCEEDGSKPQYRCEDKNGVFYSKCNSELPQVKVYVYDASVKNKDKGDCNRPAGENPLGDVKITFTRQGEAEVVTKTLSNGEVSIAIPFEGMEIPKGQPGHIPVSIKIEKIVENKFDGTDDKEKSYISLTDDCPCDGNQYGIVPKSFGENDVVIVTSWGSYKWFKERETNPDANKYNIRDIDVHTLKMNNAGTFEDRIYYPEGEQERGGMKLDVDNVNCYGAETVRIPTTDILNNDKRYYFSALQFSTDIPPPGNAGENPRDVLSKGLVRVYVFVDGELKRIFKSENATTNLNKVPTVWNVFRLDKSGTQVKITGTGNLQHGQIIQEIGTGGSGTNRLIGQDKSNGWTPQKAHGYY